jgi:Isochorismatase family
MRSSGNTPARLIVDMQVGMSWPAAGVRNNPGAQAAIAGLLSAWRERAAPIVHIRHISRTPGSLFWPGQPGVEFQTALAPLDSEHVVSAGYASGAFHPWSLLASARITRLRLRHEPRAILASRPTSCPMQHSRSRRRTLMDERVQLRRFTPWRLRTCKASMLPW